VSQQVDDLDAAAREVDVLLTKMLPHSSSFQVAEVVRQEPHRAVRTIHFEHSLTVRLSSPPEQARMAVIPQ
jgi:hypothetical protein